MGTTKLVEDIRTRVRAGVPEPFDIVLRDGRRIAVRQGGDVSIAPDGMRGATYRIAGHLEVFMTRDIAGIELVSTSQKRPRRKAG